MDVILHLGAHCTDGDRLLRSLLRNREPLSELGITVPGPSRYRDVLRDVATKLRGEVASQDTRDVVFETILERDEPDRLILSNPNFISMPSASVARGKLYPKAYKVGWLRNIFPENPVALFMAVRNPATFIPALFEEINDAPDFETFVADLDPLAMRWSHTVAAIQAACSDCPLTIWAHEDAPLLFGDLMRSVAGVPEAAGLHGGFDMLRDIIEPEGLKRLRLYTKANPPPNDAIRRKIMGAFLDKYAIKDEMDEVIDLPGWTADLVTELTKQYEHDLEVIETLPGVRMLVP